VIANTDLDFAHFAETDAGERSPEVERRTPAIELCKPDIRW
jgi:hypothetical protein